MSNHKNNSSNTVHFSIIGVLIVVCTLAVYTILTGAVPFTDISIGYGLFEIPQAASAQAQPIDWLFDAHFWLIAFLFAVIVVPLLYSIVVFRQEEGDETDAPHIHGNTALEIAWTVVPLIFVAAFIVWGWQSYFAVLAPSDNEVTIRAQAYKWDWDFYYPEHDNMFSKSIVVPVGQPVLLEMQSRDVIHAFWVPAFRVKQDVFPYDTNALEKNFANADYSSNYDHYKPQIMRFTPIEEGVFRVRCAEICGTSHYAMLAHVFVLSQADYDLWVAGEYKLPADPDFLNAQPGDGYYLDELDDYLNGTGEFDPSAGGDEEPAVEVEDESAAVDGTDES